jgi:hypothetical protein
MAISSSPPKPLSQQLLSSSPLPSPTAVLRQISKAQAEARSKKDIWEIPDSQDDEPPPPSPVKATRKPRKTKPKVEPVALKPKSTNRDVKLGLKSKYFAQDEEVVLEKEKPVRKTAIRKKATTITTATAAAASKVTKKKAAPKKQTVETDKEPEESFPRSSPPPARRQWTPPVEDPAALTALDPQVSAEPTEFSSKIGALAYQSESSQEREQLPVKAQPENFTRKRRIEVRLSHLCRCRRSFFELIPFTDARPTEPQSHQRS